MPDMTSSELLDHENMNYTSTPNNSVDLTFISIHDLTPEARILYSSDSIVDVLGYTPDELVNRSAWDFFPADELPYAKDFHQHGIAMDRAAMLAYCTIQDRSGQWVGCECCFTIVYDVMVVCTSIYRRGTSSQKRANEAPVIRRMFSSSPRDPRYHMLTHISHKFQRPQKIDMHEPRAALFLNRFTRTLTIMYATSGLEEIVGIPAEAMRGQSFYYCIAENCLQDAVKCLENAKGNDSIAYLRFWFRDPRINNGGSNNDSGNEDSDEEMTTDTSVDQDFSGGVHLDGDGVDSDASTHSNAMRSSNSMDIDNNKIEPQSRTSSGDSTDPYNTHEAIFGNARAAESSASSSPPSPEFNRAEIRHGDPIELEAVISCASDGLVVCLRRARPLMPAPAQRPTEPVYANGLFAAPWANEPVVPPIETRYRSGNSSNFAPSLGPLNAQRDTHMSGPAQQDFMASIREQAIFAWALTGINGSLHRYSGGTPHGESMPPQGLPVWQSDKTLDRNDSAGGEMEERTDSATAGLDGEQKPPQYQEYLGPSPRARNGHFDVFGDPGLFKSSSGRASSASTGNYGNTGPYG